MNLPPHLEQCSPEEKKKYIDNQKRWNHKHKVTMSKSPFLVCDKALEKMGFQLNSASNDETLFSPKIERPEKERLLGSQFNYAEKFDTTEDFFGCDDSYKYGAFDRITVIPETNTVVRFTTETYDLEEGMTILDQLRATRYAMKEGQGLVEPEEVA